MSKLLALALVTALNLGIVLTFEGYPLVRVLFATAMALNWYTYGYYLGRQAGEVDGKAQALDEKLG